MTDSSTEIIENAPENVLDADGVAGDDAGIARLREDIDRLEREAADAKDLARRARADLANVRRRAETERAELRSRTLEEVSRGILPVLDDLARAVHETNRTASPGPAADDPAHEAFVRLRDGLRLVLRGFEATLARQGLVEIEAEGTLFDPHLHEAVLRTPIGAEQADGEVIAVVRRGYLLDGRVIRAAEVVVAGKDGAPGDAEGTLAEAEAGEDGAPEKPHPA